MVSASFNFDKIYLYLNKESLLRLKLIFLKVTVRTIYNTMNISHKLKYSFLYMPKLQTIGL